MAAPSLSRRPAQAWAPTAGAAAWEKGAAGRRRRRSTGFENRSSTVAIDRLGDGEEEENGTTQQRRLSKVPPLPLGKSELSSSASLPAGVRRRNSFVAKLVASWQFAQRKRLRRQGKTRVFRFLLLLTRSPLFPSSVHLLFPSRARPLPSKKPNKKTDALDFLGYAILGLLSYASESSPFLLIFSFLLRFVPTHSE